MDAKPTKKRKGNGRIDPYESFERLPDKFQPTREGLDGFGPGNNTKKIDEDLRDTLTPSHQDKTPSMKRSGRFNETAEIKRIKILEGLRKDGILAPPRAKVQVPEWQQKTTKDNSPASKGNSPQVVRGAQWKCKKCTFMNDANDDECFMKCGGTKHEAVKAQQEAFVPRDDDYWLLNEKRNNFLKRKTNIRDEIRQRVKEAASKTATYKVTLETDKANVLLQPHDQDSHGKVATITIDLNEHHDLAIGRNPLEEKFTRIPEENEHKTILVLSGGDISSISRKHCNITFKTDQVTIENCCEQTWASETIQVKVDNEPRKFDTDSKSVTVPDATKTQTITVEFYPVQSSNDDPLPCCTLDIVKDDTKEQAARKRKITEEEEAARNTNRDVARVRQVATLQPQAQKTANHASNLDEYEEYEESSEDERIIEDEQIIELNTAPQQRISTNNPKNASKKQASKEKQWGKCLFQRDENDHNRPILVKENGSKIERESLQGFVKKVNRYKEHNYDVKVQIPQNITVPELTQTMKYIVEHKNEVFALADNPDGEEINRANELVEKARKLQLEKAGYERNTQMVSLVDKIQGIRHAKWNAPFAQARNDRQREKYRKDKDLELKKRARDARDARDAKDAKDARDAEKTKQEVARLNGINNDTIREHRDTTYVKEMYEDACNDKIKDVDNDKIKDVVEFKPHKCKNMIHSETLGQYSESEGKNWVDILKTEGPWYIEPKYDGHRVFVHVPCSLGDIEAYMRPTEGARRAHYMTKMDINRNPFCLQLFSYNRKNNNNKPENLNHLNKEHYNKEAYLPIYESLHELFYGMKQRLAQDGILQLERNEFIETYGDLNTFIFDGEVVPWLFEAGKPVKPEPFATNIVQFAPELYKGVGLMVVLFDMVSPKKPELTYDKRRELLEACFQMEDNSNLTSHKNVILSHRELLDENPSKRSETMSDRFKKWVMEEHFEGIIVKHGHGIYNDTKGIIQHWYRLKSSMLTGCVLNCKVLGVVHRVFRAHGSDVEEDEIPLSRWVRLLLGVQNSDHLEQNLPEDYYETIAWVGEDQDDNNISRLPFEKRAGEATYLHLKHFLDYTLDWFQNQEKLKRHWQLSRPQINTIHKQMADILNGLEQICGIPRGYLPYNDKGLVNHQGVLLSEGVKTHGKYNYIIPKDDAMKPSHFALPKGHKHKKVPIYTDQDIGKHNKRGQPIEILYDERFFYFPCDLAPVVTVRGQELEGFRGVTFMKDDNQDNGDGASKGRAIRFPVLHDVPNPLFNAEVKLRVNPSLTGPMIYNLTEKPRLQHEIDADMYNGGAEGENTGEDTGAKEAEIKSVAMMPLANPEEWFETRDVSIQSKKVKLVNITCPVFRGTEENAERLEAQVISHMKDHKAEAEDQNPERLFGDSDEDLYIDFDEF